MDSPWLLWGWGSATASLPKQTSGSRSLPPWFLRNNLGMESWKYTKWNKNITNENQVAVATNVWILNAPPSAGIKHPQKTHACWMVLAPLTPEAPFSLAQDLPCHSQPDKAGLVCTISAETKDHRKPLHFPSHFHHHSIAVSPWSPARSDNGHLSECPPSSVYTYSAPTRPTTV